MRGLVIDAGVKERLGRAVGKGFQAGALVGRQLPNGSREYIVAAVPFKDDDDLDWEAAADVPRKVVEAQLRQLGRMLVGGISICGLYVVSRDLGKTAVETLHRLWPSPAGGRPSRPSVTMVHVSTQSSQFTVRVGPPKGELGPVDVKYQSVAAKFITYHCMTDVSLQFDVPPVPASAPATATEDDEDASIEALLDAEDAFFRAFLRATKEAEALLERAVCFPAVGEDGGEEGRFTKIGPNLARLVEVYTDAFVTEGRGAVSASSSSSSGGGSRPKRPVRVVGSVGCVACIHEKESDQDGIAALKEDFIRSLRDRAHLLRDEAATELEDGGPATSRDPASLGFAIHNPEGGLLRLPRRVLLPYDAASSSSMLVADYLLPGEEEAEALARFRETLGVASSTGGAGAVVILPEMEVSAACPSGGLARISSCNSMASSSHACGGGSGGGELARIGSTDSLGHVPTKEVLSLAAASGAADAMTRAAAAARVGAATAAAAAAGKRGGTGLGPFASQSSSSSSLTGQPATVEHERSGSKTDAAAPSAPAAAAAAAAAAATARAVEVAAAAAAAAAKQDDAEPAAAASAAIATESDAGVVLGMGKSGFTSVSTSPLLMVCLLALGLAMAVGAAFFLDAGMGAAAGLKG